MSFWYMCLKQLTDEHANRRKRLGNVRLDIRINIELGWVRVKETEQEHSMSCGILLACVWRLTELGIHELNSKGKLCHYKMSRFSFVICVVSLTLNFIRWGSESNIERDGGFMWKKMNMCLKIILFRDLQSVNWSRKWLPRDVIPWVDTGMK